MDTMDFIQLYNKGLAYVDEVAVNWCPALGTVLSNEEVVDGVSERGGHPVYRRPMKQWVLKITEYADRLLEDLDELDWPESIKDMQRNGLDVQKVRVFLLRLKIKMLVSMCLQRDQIQFTVQLS